MTIIDRILGALRRVFADPWQGGEGYVLAYKEALGVAAAGLSPSKGRLRAGFNQALGCAEIAGNSGVVARLIVHGECGLPSAAYVFADGLDAGERGILAAAFDGLSVVFKPRGARDYPGGLCRTPL